MDRFKAQPDEEILLKGALIYRKSKWRFVRCQGILTSKRLVMGKRLNPMWSIIPRIYSYIRGKKIVFQIPLQSFDSIRHNRKEMGQYIILKTDDGAEYPIVPDGIFGKRETWLKAIPDAVSAAFPETEVKLNADSVEFLRP